MVCAMSASVISRGTAIGCGPVAVNMSPTAATADGASGALPCGVFEGCDIRPTCMSCTTNVEPASCTASATRPQASACSSVWMPGVVRYPCPSSDGCVPSVMSMASEARCE